MLFGKARPRKWNRQAASAAADVLAVARKGRAFDSIGAVHAKHSGLAILQGGVLAVGWNSPRVGSSLKQECARYGGGGTGRT